MQRVENNFSSLAKLLLKLWDNSKCSFDIQFPRYIILLNERYKWISSLGNCLILLPGVTPTPYVVEEDHCFIHACACVQSCWTLCDPTDCNPPGSSVHGIFQTRILKWVAVSSSRWSFQLRDWTHNSCVSCIGRSILYHGATWEALFYS